MADATKVYVNGEHVATFKHPADAKEFTAAHRRYGIAHELKSGRAKFDGAKDVEDEPAKPETTADDSSGPSADEGKSPDSETEASKDEGDTAPTSGE